MGVIDEVLREKGKKKKTRGRRRALGCFGVWRNGREKKGGKKGKKKKKKIMGVTDEVLREKGERKKKKKRKKESSRTFWSLEEWQGEKWRKEGK